MKRTEPNSSPADRKATSMSSPVIAILVFLIIHNFLAPASGDKWKRLQGGYLLRLHEEPQNCLRNARAHGCLSTRSTAAMRSRALQSFKTYELDDMLGNVWQWVADDYGRQAEALSLLARSLGRAVPVWYGLCLALLALDAYLHLHQATLAPLLVAAALWAGTIVLSISALVPINNRIASLNTAAPAPLTTIRNADIQKQNAEAALVT